jgi:hypothetical protein
LHFKSVRHTSHGPRENNLNQASFSEVRIWEKINGIKIRESNTKLLSIYFYFKLYVLWLDPPPIESPGIETLYVEVARRSGGEFFYTKASDFSQAGRGQPDEMEQVTEVRHLIVNTTASVER